MFTPELPFDNQYKKLISLIVNKKWWLLIDFIVNELSCEWNYCNKCCYSMWTTLNHTESISIYIDFWNNSTDGGLPIMTLGLGKPSNDVPEHTIVDEYSERYYFADRRLVDLWMKVVEEKVND